MTVIVPERFRQRVKAVRRQRLRRRTVAAALIAAPVLLAGAVTVTPLLDVRDIDVRGTARLRAADVTAAARIRPGTEMLRLDLSAIERRVAALPLVRSVTVHRRWPSRVEIVVVERQPAIVVATSTGYALYDAEGFVVSRTAAPSRAAPLLTLAPGAPSERIVPGAVFLMRYLPVGVRARVRALRASTPDDLSLTLDDGAVVVWGSAEQSPEKLRALVSLLPRRARHYDLRAPRNPSIR